MINKKYKDVLILIAQGKSDKDIAKALSFSNIYIRKIVSKLLKLYNVKNRTELAIEYNAELKGNY